MHASPQWAHTPKLSMLLPPEEIDLSWLSQNWQVEAADGGH